MILTVHKVSLSPSQCPCLLHTASVRVCASVNAAAAVLLFFLSSLLLFCYISNNEQEQASERQRERERGYKIKITKCN